MKSGNKWKVWRWIYDGISNDQSVDIVQTFNNSNAVYIKKSDKFCILLFNLFICRKH